MSTRIVDGVVVAETYSEIFRGMVARHNTMPVQVFDSEFDVTDVEEMEQFGMHVVVLGEDAYGDVLFELA